MNIFRLIFFSIISNFLISSMIFADSAPANHSPSYKDGKLIVPHVDTQEMLGKFQDATFEFNEQTSSWNLLDYKEAILAPISKVRVIQPDSFPAQIFLEVSGATSQPCYTFYPVNQRLEGNRIDIAIPIKRIGELCADMLAPFKKIIPLSVYGLDAGEYEFNVLNRKGDNIRGTFTLSRDNIITVEEDNNTGTVQLIE